MSNQANMVIVPCFVLVSVSTQQQTSQIYFYVCVRLQRRTRKKKKSGFCALYSLKNLYPALVQLLRMFNVGCCVFLGFIILGMAEIRGNDNHIFTPN